MKHDCEIPTNKTRTIPWFFLMLLTVTLSVAVLLAAVPRTFAAPDTLEVYQQTGNRVFGKTTSLDIFQDTKRGGQKLLAPNSEGSYTFAVHNKSASDPLPYAINITAVNPDNIPIVVSVTKNGAYIYGGSSPSSMRRLSAYQFDDELSGNDTDIYIISWSWNTESDTTDTQIGLSGPVYYTLVITAMGTIDETHAVQTGDQTQGIVWAALALTSVIILFVIFNKQRKTKDEDSQAVFETT